MDRLTARLPTVARSAEGLWLRKTMLWIMFQERAKHPLGGTREEAATLITNLMSLGALLYLSSLCDGWQLLKKGHWRASYLVHIAMLALVTSIGRVSSAVVVVGSPLLFSSIKAESTSAASDAKRSREGGYPARTSSVRYTANTKYRPLLGSSKYSTQCQCPFMGEASFAGIFAILIRWAFPSRDWRWSSSWVPFGIWKTVLCLRSFRTREFPFWTSIYWRWLGFSELTQNRNNYETRVGWGIPFQAFGPWRVDGHHLYLWFFLTTPAIEHSGGNGCRVFAVFSAGTWETNIFIIHVLWLGLSR